MQSSSLIWFWYLVEKLFKQIFIFLWKVHKRLFVIVFLISLFGLFKIAKKIFLGNDLGKDSRVKRIKKFVNYNKSCKLGNLKI